jgi:hypothetical protein
MRKQQVANTTEEARQEQRQMQNRDAGEREESNSRRIRMPDDENAIHMPEER